MIKETLELPDHRERLEAKDHGVSKVFKESKAKRATKVILG